MGWRIYDEAVDVIKRRFQYFPLLFRWRGRHYHVDAVDRSWTVSQRVWRRRVERRFFQVRSGEGTFELYQDLRTGGWHLRRARLASVPGRMVRTQLALGVTGGRLDESRASVVRQ
jgi:hypothetical protein